MNAATISFLVYTLVLISLGVWSYRIVEKVPITKYEQEFYTAGRGLGGIIVAMLIAGGLASAGTFIAGPGMTFNYGFSWVFMNNFQIFMNLLLLAPIGIIVGIVARRVNALTYLDVFKARYQSSVVVALLAYTVYGALDKSVKDWHTGLIAVVSFIVVAFLNVHPALVILTAAVLGLLVYR